MAAAGCKKSPDVAGVVSITESARTNFVWQEARWHYKGKTNLFTGCMVDYSTNGFQVWRSMITNGLPNGLCETWYTNGQLQMREYFKDGYSDGVREKWYSSGAKLSQASIVKGQVVGVFKSWHENGHLNEEIEMQAGKPQGKAWSHYPSGCLKSASVVSNGAVLEQKCWKDGEKPPSPK